MKTFIYLIFTEDMKDSNGNVIINRGWGNGYVCLPKEHKFFGKDYDEIHELTNINIHGGLTFSAQEGEYWTVGFDTAHFGDDKTKWTKELVLKETLKLQEQLNK